MNNTIRTTLRLSAATLAALGLVAGALWWGVYDVGADTPHTRPVYAVLEFARERSIAMRAVQVTVPALDDERRIRNGAGNYQAMCAGCHLGPGMAPTSPFEFLDSSAMCSMVASKPWPNILVKKNF
jgi:hypothetical protein